MEMHLKRLSFTYFDLKYGRWVPLGTIRGNKATALSSKSTAATLCLLSNIPVLNLGRKLDHSNRQLIAAQERRPEPARRQILSWVGLGEQPCYLARVRGMSASRRAAIPHAKAASKRPSASSVKFAAKSAASPYFAVFLCCSLAVSFKRLGQAARWVQRAVHGVERKISQLETAGKLALRKDIAAHQHGFRLTSGASIL